MALNIKDPEAERLAEEVARLAGETKTRAVKVALQERRARLTIGPGPPPRAERLRRLLEDELWPQVPVEVRGRSISRAEREATLGYGPAGV